MFVYLWHESHRVLICSVEVSAVQGDLHLSQEGVAAEAAVVPYRYQHGAGKQLRAADGVLLVEDEEERTGSKACLTADTAMEKSYINVNALVLREVYKNHQSRRWIQILLEVVSKTS